MANAVEKLFDSILPNLDEGEQPRWPIPDDLLDEWEADDALGLPEYLEAGELNEEDLGRDRGLILGPNTEDKEAFEGAIRHVGIDALAFYKSRRFLNLAPCPGKWGIFYFYQGLGFVSSELQKEYPSAGNHNLLALNFLREHERFHYRADLQTLMFEATLGKSLYLPIRKALRGRRSQFAEEALANRQVWEWAKKPSVGIREFAEEFMRLQPNAYARFDENPLKLAAEWATTVIDFQPPGTAIRTDLAPWIDNTPKDLLRPTLCPEHRVPYFNPQHWIDPAMVPPPVRSVEESQNLKEELSGKLNDLAEQWGETKTKLLANRLLRGLNFKPWTIGKEKFWSVRVNDGSRAHLRHLGDGRWEAYEIGSHKALGHG